MNTEFYMQFGLMLTQLLKLGLPNHLIIDNDEFLLSIFNSDFEQTGSYTFEPGDIETVCAVQEHLAQFQEESKYVVEFKNRIFDLSEVFDNEKDASDYCHEINTKFELNINWRKESVRVKKN